MKLSPEEFINLILSGKSEKELNQKEDNYIDPTELNRLTSARYGHTIETAKDHLLTDYSNGFTICKCCGSFYQLGEGFTKHLSNGCLHCEGDGKHYTFFHKGNNERNYKTEPRWMSAMFDDGMYYCKDNLELEKFKPLFPVKNKILYEDIKLTSKVWSPDRREQGEIVSINNVASLVGISEPIFTVKFKDYAGGRETFGLKYIRKMIVK